MKLFSQYKINWGEFLDVLIELTFPKHKARPDSLSNLAYQFRKLFSR